jgi:Protein of unknown function (DUF1579)
MWPAVYPTLVAVYSSAVPQFRDFLLEGQMTFQRLAALCLVVLAVGGTATAQVPAATKSPDSPLAPVAWLISGTWTSDVKDPGDGSVTHVENHITWAPNHQAIQFVTDFNGKPHYNGFYAYDPVKKSINFYYTSEEGQLTIGTATPDADSKTLHQEFDVLQPTGKTQHVKSTIVRDGDNAYDFSVFLQDKTGEWAEAFKIRYERK